MGGLERLGVHIAVAAAAVVVIGWVGLMAQPRGWIKKQSQLYTIDCGLADVQFSQGVAVSATGAVVGMVSSKAANAITSFGPYGTYGLQEWSQRMCSLRLLDYFPKTSGGAASLCGFWEGVQYASTALLIGASLALVVYIWGVGMLCYWFFVKPRAVLRKWARSTLLAGVATLSASTLQYALVTANVKRMPPEGGSTLGPNVMRAMMLCCVANIPLLVSLLLGASVEEVRNEALSEQKHFLWEHEKLYGAADQEAPLAQDGPGWGAPQGFGAPPLGQASWAAPPDAGSWQCAPGAGLRGLGAGPWGPGVPQGMPQGPLQAGPQGAPYG